MRIGAAVILSILLLSGSQAVARPASPPPDSLRARVRAATIPELSFCIASHSIGKLGLGIDAGWLGGAYQVTPQDCFLGEWRGAGGEYPRHSGIAYLSSAALWVGGVVGKDTLVSTVIPCFNESGHEFYADAEPMGRIVYRSTRDPEAPEFAGALSEEDFIAKVTDTYTVKSGLYGLQYPDFLTGDYHKPLFVEIEQRSYAWSVAYAEDLVLFDLRVTNIGDSYLENVYVGIRSDQDCGDFSEFDTNFISEDDVCGLLKTYPSPRGCGFLDTLNLAWVVDNDGDPVNGRWSYVGDKSVLSVEGIRFLQVPRSTQTVSYNWWVNNYDIRYDFGPRRKPTPEHPWRDFQTGGIGAPWGDKNKYYIMSNGETDYDQPFVSSIMPEDPEWMFPPWNIRDYLADGDDTYYVLSFGPFRLRPGAQVSLAFAYVAGENFHSDPANGANLRNKQPTTWYQNVSFDDIALNSMWAEWLYDNPGVDTDSDGYAGEYRVCVLDSQFIGGQWVITAADTTYHHGDGIPDWRGVQPPPPPVFWLEPQLNGIRIRFNGQASETTKDIFSGLIDFEGYHIWLGRDERESSLSLLASYDRENYDKWVWNKFMPPAGDFVIQDVPMTLDEIRCRYGSGIDPCDDSLFHPLSFDRTNPYRYKYAVDSIFYFTPHDKNVYRLGVQTPIRKVYPDAHKPTGLDTVKAEDLTPEGYLKYYEYECFVENLLPTVPYHINVTAYDFGSPKVKLPSLETSKMMGLEHAFPYADEAQTDTTLPPVYIYPNPYRTDADYRAAGFEGRGSSRIPDRDRRIHFVNLPPRCTIRIHSLDGDLIREIWHDFDPADPNSRHDSWDLINRNIQAVVSGLYYWSVESTDGSVQMGTLAIIK